jgi:hypothetical protein
MLQFLILDDIYNTFFAICEKDPSPYSCINRTMMKAIAKATKSTSSPKCQTNRFLRLASSFAASELCRAVQNFAKRRPATTVQKLS